MPIKLSHRIKICIGLGMGIFCFLKCDITNTTLLESQAPNIIFIMSDDHAAHAIGAYKQRLASLNPTPTMDKLAEEGMLFTNVFCTNSICTPSRATILTGQYSQTNGVLDLDGSLPEARQYLPKELNRLGYQTAVIGKWHLKEAPEAFDYYKVLPVQGNYFDPIFYTREPADTSYVFNFRNGLKREINVSQYTGHSSDVITDLSLDWLEHKRKKDQAFFLMHQYKAPHDHFEYAPRYADYLADTFIPEPASLYEQRQFGSEAIKGKHDSLIHQIGKSISDRHLYRNYTQHYNITTTPRAKATSEAYQEYTKRYLRCVKGIDDNLERLFSYLKQNNLWENTIIIYTSDQGMMLGEHDFMDKRWMYEESLRMPFIISYPKKIQAGSQSDLLINNTDFAPTLIELAGGIAPNYMQGKSFANTVNGKSESSWRTASYYRYWMHLVHHDVPAHFGIRTKDYKLIYYYADHYKPEKNGQKTMNWQAESFSIRPTPVAWEFYDLTKDPNELMNRYKDETYQDTIAHLKRELIRMRSELNETDDRYPHLKKRIERNWNL